jgi:hypothetical protein
MAETGLVEYICPMADGKVSQQHMRLQSPYKIDGITVVEIGADNVIFVLLNE